MIFEALYDSGKVEIYEKNLPNIKSNAFVILKDPTTSQDVPNKGKKSKRIKAFGIWKNRKDIRSSVMYIQNLRRKIDKRVV
jgi:hypothetical protein